MLNTVIYLMHLFIDRHYLIQTIFILQQLSNKLFNLY